jgi:ABC-type amino acid transport substrate-binding protein
LNARLQSFVPWLLASSVLLASGLPVNAQDLELTTEERAWLKDNPVIRVHNEMDWPPFNFNEDGQPTGFSIDFMNLVASKVGLEVKYISGPTWQEFLDMLRAGELDVIANATPNEERAQYMSFTSAFYEQPVAVVVENSTEGINSLDDLSGRKVAVVEGFFQQQFMEDNYPDAELVLNKNLLDSLYSVLEGRAECMIAALPPTRYLIDKQSLVGLRVAVISRDTRLLSKGGLAVRKDWPILRDILQKGMDSVSEAELAGLRGKWFGTEFIPEPAAERLELTTEEQAWISEHPTIRAQNEMNWPPFNFNENGQPQGFSIDLMDLIAANAGLNVEYISGPGWDEFKEMLGSGGLDVLLNVDTSPPKPDYAIFTTNYATMAAAVFVSDPDLKLDSLDDLEKLRIAVTRGFSTQRYLEREYPDAELLLVDTLQDAVFAVMDGRADAVVDDFPAINYIIEQNTLTGLHVAMMSREPELVADIAIGVRKDWPILRKILQKSLDSLDPDSVNELRSRWLGQQTRQRDVKDGFSDTIFWLIGITLGVFLLLIVLNRVSSYYARSEGVGLQTGTARFRVFLLSGLSIFVALVGILGWIALNQIKGKILTDVGNNLQSVLLTTGQRLDLWVNQQEDVLQQIVRNVSLVEQIEFLQQVPANSEDLIQSAELAAIRATLEEYDDALGLGFFLINPDGISIGSRRDSNLGTKNIIAETHPQRLQRVFNGEPVFIPPMQSDVSINNNPLEYSSSLFIAVPVLGVDGTVIAALTVRLDPDEGFSRVLQFSRVGESGERMQVFWKPGSQVSGISRFVIRAAT